MKPIHHLVVIPLALAFLTACGTTPSEQAKAAAPLNPLEIQPDSGMMERLRVGVPRMQPVAGTLRVAGRIEADETRVARVSAPVTGRILELKAVEGQHVKKNQVLATIYSTELSSAQSEFLKAHSQLQAAQRAVSRAKLLLDADVIGSAELQRREAETMQASADVAAAREQLRVLGFTDEHIHKLEADHTVTSTNNILSSIDGIVMERNATTGQVVQAVQTVFVVADLSKVWLVADVPEQSAGSLQIGKAIEAEIPALPDIRIKGRLSFVSAIVNPETRTVRTRMDLPNPRRIFKPAMLTTITLLDRAEEKLVVPETAVVRENDADWVFVETKPKTFALRRVTLGDDAGDTRVILNGIMPSERIVLDGAFHLNNERKRRTLGDESGD